MNGTDMHLDENAEVIAEYAMNFGLSMPNDGRDNPTDEVVKDLNNRLLALFMAHIYQDMPLDDNPMQSIDWMIHMDTIVVRRDGYPNHVYEIFKEMFLPHTPFYQQQFGYSVDQLLDFFMDLENRVICKIGSQDTIYGITKMHDRWVKWEKRLLALLEMKPHYRIGISQKVCLASSLKQTLMCRIRKMVCNS